MAKISIITTTYKHKAFIRYTIESVLSQTFSDWELLIGDDSPDTETREIIQEYVKKYPDKIKARHHTPNKGIVDNMNFLLSQVSEKSEYISFLEGDDMYTPDNLEEKIKILQTKKDVVLVYSDLSFIDKNNHIILQSFFEQRKIPFYRHQTIPVDTFILQEAGPIASWSTAMIRKSTLDEYKIINREPNNIRYSVSDYDLYFRIATQNKVFGIKKSLTQYRRHSGNLSGSNGGTSDDLDRLMDYYYANDLISAQLYATKKSWTKIVSAIFDLEVGNKNSALKNYIQSLKYSIFSYPLFKIAILGFLVLPNSLNKKILQTLIKRG